MTPAPKTRVRIDPTAEPVSAEPPMGSEYRSARSAFPQWAKVVKRPADSPAHGSNDSDFIGRDPLKD